MEKKKKKHHHNRVPQVLWKLFKNRARTLSETILSISSSLQCRHKDNHDCLRCSTEPDRMSFLLRKDDPSDYQKLLNHCFVVVSENTPSLKLFDPNSRWSQLEIVRRTIEMLSNDNKSTKNVMCTGYDKHNRSSIVLEALTSASWSLLLKRVGDGLMVHLLKYSSIFMPLHRNKHHQVAGISIDDLCWDHLRHVSQSKNQQIPLVVPRRHLEVVPVSMDIDIPESSVTCHADSITDVPESSVNCHADSIPDVDCTHTTQENGVLPVTKSGKRLRSHSRQRKHKRRKLSSQNTSDTNCSLQEEKTNFPCSCCSLWQTLQKLPRENQINKRSMLYKLERGSSILPGKHILNSLRPNAVGVNALLREIFGLSNNCIAAQPAICSHRNNPCAIKTTCLYHSLHKLLKILIRKAIHCPRSRILKKHIFTDANESGSPVSGHAQYCSKRQVVSFLWAACRSIVPQELLGSSSDCRILRKNLSKFIRLRIYEKFSLHQCMHKLKTSNFPFLSDKNSICNLSMKRDILKRWIYWLFTCLVVPLLQANFYITESEHGKLEVFFYEKSHWENLMKNSISCLTEQCYSLLDVKSVKQIVSSRTFGFSKVRFRPKANGIRPLANLKSSSRLPLRDACKEFKPVNVVLRDLHAALKDSQLVKPEKLGSSVFSYNDVHRKLRGFLSRVKSGLNMSSCVYMVVADAQKAYDSIDHDKLLHVMKDVITDDHLLHRSHQIVVSNGGMQVCQHINMSRKFRSHVHARSFHSVYVDQGKSRIARKDDLHFNLQQHVKYNLLHIDKRFYLQNVGIPQGSILSSLLCSFYYGHMENTKLVPFLNKVAESEFPDRHDLLLRFVDDFLFISTSKKQALAFFSRLERGFCEYNCNMNKEKFGLSFEAEKIRPQSNRAYLDESCNKFLRWSGLYINCKTLEVQADYTRYLDGHLRSTLTVCMQGNPGRRFREKVCDYLRPKCHAIFYDSNINSAAVVRLNIHQAFLLCAMKFHCYVCDLSDVCRFDLESYMDIIDNSLRYMYKLMKKRMYSLDVDNNSRGILKVKKQEVKWLGLRAYSEVIKRKQSRYKELLYLLELKLKSLDVEMVSPALKFAVDKSNSSVLWKIKF